MYHVSARADPTKRYPIGTTIHPTFGIFVEGNPAPQNPRLPKAPAPPLPPPHREPYNASDYFLPKYRHDNRVATILDDHVDLIPRDFIKEPMEDRHLRLHRQQPFTTRMEHLQNELLDTVGGKLEALMALIRKLHTLNVKRIAE